MYLNKMATFICVLLLILSRAPLTFDYMFAMIIVYENIKGGCQNFGTALNHYAELKIAVRRFQEFFLSDRQTPSTCDNCILTSDQNLNQSRESSGVLVRNVSVKWDSSLPNYVLKDATFEAKSSELVAHPLPTCLGLGNLPERFMGKQIVVCHLPWSTFDSLNNFLSTTTSTLPLNTATFSKSVNCVPQGLGNVFIKNNSIWKIFSNT
jgi:hypothetical protein